VEERQIGDAMEVIQTTEEKDLLIMFVVYLVSVEPVGKILKRNKKQSKHGTHEMENKVMGEMRR